MKEKNLHFIAFVCSYIVTRILYKLFNLSYSITNDQFDLVKLIKDFGCWVITYVLIYYALTKLIKNKK